MKNKNETNDVCFGSTLLISDTIEVCFDVIKILKIYLCHQKYWFIRFNRVDFFLIRNL